MTEKTTVKMLWAILTIFVFMMLSVQYAKAYERQDSKRHIFYPTEYCFTMPSVNGVVKEVGCLIGKDYGKIGAKKDAIRQVVKNLNKNKDSEAYKQLISEKGLKLRMKDTKIGTHLDAWVWQNNKNGQLRIVLGDEKEEP